MDPNDATCHFVPVEEVWDEIHEFFKVEKEELLKQLVGIPVAVEHIGGSTVPGSLTKIDVDIQVRVDRDNFQPVIERMKNYATVNHPNIWTDDRAIFKIREKKFETDYIVTVLGSESDACYPGVRDLLMSDPQLLKDYNNLKKSFEGKPYKDCRVAKKQFWIPVFRNRLGLKEVT